MTHPRPLRIGLIGASVGPGWSNIAHLPALQALPHCELVAVATRNTASAEAAARAYGASFAFSNPSELIAQPEVEAVSVCVRASGHFDLVVAAIAAGKHVYCEWPLGVTSAESRILADQARARGIVNMVGLQSHGSPVLQRVRALIAARYIGDVLSTTFTSSEPGGWGAETHQAFAYGADATQGATPLTLTAGHALDAICWCLGEFASLNAIVTNRRTSTRIIETDEVIPVSAPDQIAVVGHLVGGTIASVHVRAGSPTYEGLRWEINGTKGYLLLTDVTGVQVGQPRLLAHLNGKPAVEIEPWPNDPKIPDGVLHGPALNVAHQYASLVQAVRSGRRVVPDFEYAVGRRTLLDALQSSSETGKRAIL